MSTTSLRGAGTDEHLWSPIGAAIAVTACSIMRGARLPLTHRDRRIQPWKVGAEGATPGIHAAACQSVGCQAVGYYQRDWHAVGRLKDSTLTNAFLRGIARTIAAVKSMPGSTARRL